MKTNNILVGRIVAIAAFFIVALFAPVAVRAAGYTVISYDYWDGLSSQTLTKNKSPYLVVHDCYNNFLKAGKTLIVEAGVVVKFAPASNCGWTKSYTGLVIYGNFIVNGTPSDPVVFTSWNDDSAGGDTNGDGSSISPQPGDWGSFQLNATAGNILIHNAIFRYGGGASGIGMISVSYNAVNPTLDSLELAFSSNTGLSASRSLDIHNSRFHDNTREAIWASSVWTPQINATNNWWGDDSGPTASSNPSGKGQAIYGNVIYDPWIGKPLPNNAPTLAYSNDPGYETDGVEPNTAFMSQPPVFKIVYADPDNDAPEYIKLVIDGNDFNLATSTPNKNFISGQIYEFATGVLTAGIHSYHFETSDGNYTARLPASGELEFEIKNNPVIIIPGILGSEQKDGVWVIDPILHTYDNLIDTFKANGFTEGTDLFTFPYQWRQSNVESAVQLKEKIDEVKQICNCDKVDLVAHSMGGIVARQYIQSDAYAHDVNQLIFLGTPQLGAPYAYLTWEAGENGRAIVDRVINFMFTREAEKAGYASLFDYVRHKPINSVEELLPIYDYIKDKETNRLRTYPNNYPESYFLENLNNNVGKLYNSGVKLSSIVGDLGPGSTLNTIRVIDSPFLPLWKDGFPDGYDGTTADLGLEAGNGDGTVPIDSSEGLDCDTTVLNSEHIILPTDAEKLVVGKLSAIQDPITINNPYLPNITLLIIKILSPVDIVVIAPDGKRVGKDFSTNQEVNEIDGAFYSGFQTDNEFITIPNPLDGEYKVQAQGTGNGGEYTVAAGYISDSGLSDSDYKSNILPGVITELNVNVNSSSPDDLQVKPADNILPKITINSPSAQDYIREDPLVISVSTTDAGPGWSQILTFDGKIVQNGSAIDLFAEKLGNHNFTATLANLFGQTVTATVAFRLIVTPSSVIGDIEKMYSLGWIKNKSSKNVLINNLKLIIRLNKIVEIISQKIPLPKNAPKKIEKIEEKIDKILGRQFLKELEKKKDKAINEQAYNLLIEDINWLLNN